MYHDYCIIEPAFLFFLLPSGRPLLATTFFVFSKSLCSADCDSGIFCTAATALFIAVKVLSTAAKICNCCSQRFYSSFVVLLEAFFFSAAAALLILYGSFCTLYNWVFSASIQQPWHIWNWTIAYSFIFRNYLGKILFWRYNVQVNSGLF